MRASGSAAAGYSIATMILQSGQGCSDAVAKDLVGGSVIAKPDTSSLCITEADVGHVFVGEQISRTSQEVIHCTTLSSGANPFVSACDPNALRKPH
jgi:hypothetical protein